MNTSAAQRVARTRRKPKAGRPHASRERDAAKRAAGRAISAGTVAGHRERPGPEWLRAHTRARAKGPDAKRRFATTPTHLRIDQFWEVGLEALVRPLLISSHQARIARHIDGKDRYEARGHVLPGGKVPLFSLPQNRRCPYGACANPLTS